MFVAQSELFKDLSQGALEGIRMKGAVKTYRAGDVVFREGDEADNFYVLAEGTVHLVMGDEEQLCFAVGRPGEVFGWSALVEPYRYRASASCTAAARVIDIPRSAVEQVMKDYPGDAITIFRNLAGIVTEKLRGAYQERISDAALEGVASATNEDLQRLT